MKPCPEPPFELRPCPAVCACGRLAGWEQGGRRVCGMHKKHSRPARRIGK